MTRRLAMPLASVLALVMLTMAGLAVTTAQASDPDVSPFYDLNGNGVIDRDEAITAVSDYFAGVITRDQVLVIIQYYFSGDPVPPVEDVLPPEPPTRSLSDVIEDVRPAVVYVRNIDVGAGSGVIFKTEGETGYVMTNSHVVDDNEGEGWAVRTDDGEWYRATLLRADPVRDLAVLTICCDDFIAADFAESDDVLVGDQVFAMGYPDPLRYDTATVTTGVVSAIRYSWNRASMVVQTDAATNPGNSGGPLFAYDGLVAGVMHSGLNYGSDGTPREGLAFGAALTTIETHMATLMTPGGEFEFEGIDGSVYHDPDKDTIKRRIINVNYFDGRADIEFEANVINPYSASTQLWSYGLIARADPVARDEEDLPSLYFVIDSRQQWKVTRVASEEPFFTTLAEGTVSSVRTGANARNHLKVRTVGNVARFWVNGQRVGGDIDISSAPHAGDIGVAGTYWKGSDRQGAVTKFEDVRGKLLDQ